MYTSLKLSKLLQENGFEGKSEKYHIPLTKGYTIGNKPEKTIDDKPFFNAYDILNDLCVTYREQMFGESLKGYPPINYVDITSDILSLLQQNKQDEAELYLWNNCKFNPNNK